MTEEHSLQGPVLLLDDDIIVCKMISTILNASGFDVHSLSDADECLSLLSAKTHKVLITDYNMPGGNGLDFFRKAREVQADIRGILLTGDFQLRAFNDIIQLGFDDCIPKSVARTLIHESLSESISLYDRWLNRKALLIQHNDTSNP